MSSFARVLVIAAVALAAPLPAMGSALGDEPAAAIRIERVEVGIGGQFKVGRWTPVRVTLETTQPRRVQLVLRAPDPDGNLVSFPTDPRQVSAGTSELVGLFQSGRLDAGLQIAVIDGDETLAARQLRPLTTAADVRLVPIEQSALLVATLGLGMETRENSAPLDQSNVSENLRLVPLRSASEIPPVDGGLASLDVLAIAGSYDVDVRQSQAIREWVRGGGHLVLSVGRGADAYRESPLAEWVPVPVEGTSRVRQLTGLETFTGKNTRIPLSGTVEAANLGATAGQVLVPGLSGPLLVRVPFGFGKVTMLAVDLDRPPLSAWESRGDLIARMALPMRDQAGGGATTRRGQLAHTGITDLATQLSAAVQQFPQVRRFSSWMVMGLILGYLLLIGPIDYLLVHRVLKRPHLTWVTFPVMVIAAALLAVWTAGQGNGTQLRVNQLDVVDIDETSNLVRTHAWASIYSPATQRYHLAVAPTNTDWGTQPVAQSESDGKDTSAPTPRVIWTGIPEKGFGGMYRPGGFEIARAAYHMEPRAEGIADLPIAIWSTKGITSDWMHTGGTLVESRLTSPGVGLLNGTIRHSLPVPIEDWMIAYGRRVYRPSVRTGQSSPPALMPHETLSPTDARIQQRDLSSYLTGTVARRVPSKSVKGTEDIRVEQARYDQRNLEPLEILRMITFHEAAGGTSYTGLENNTLRAFDLTERLGMNQAVLFGRIDARAAALLVGESADAVEPTRRWAFVRILLPVEPATERFVPFQKERG